MLSKAKKQLFAFLMAMALVFSIAITARANPVVSIISTWPYNMVDLGKHCDWDARSSNYHNLVVTGTNRWNAHRSVFRPDSILTLQDVRISDVNQAGGSYYGHYNLILGTIQFNRAFLDSSSWTDANRMHTVMHELGHALGLEENNGNDTTNIMRQGKLTNVTLSPADKASYDAAAKKY